MDKKEDRELIIQSIVDMLRNNSFSFKFEVKKNPKGIKVIYEVSQEQMDEIFNKKRKNL